MLVIKTNIEAALKKRRQRSIASADDSGCKDILCPIGQKFDKLIRRIL
jgi:hypothetical protein